jgi:hypothetical protein
MDFNLYRPFINSSSKEILEKGLNAIEAKDIETLSYCYAELYPGERGRSLTARNSLMEATRLSGLYPVTWLEKAAFITRKYHSSSTGNYSVYIILLGGKRGEQPGYAVYVGQTKMSPQQRFQTHMEGGFTSSHHVRGHGLCLLPSLYTHISITTEDESKELEFKLAEALKKQNIPVYGGH